MPANCTHIRRGKDYLLLSNYSATVGLYLSGSPRTKNNKVFCRFNVAYLRELLTLAEEVYAQDGELKAVILLNKKKQAIMMINDVALAPMIDDDCIANR
jgi:hypothetical protein